MHGHAPTRIYFRIASPAGLDFNYDIKNSHSLGSQTITAYIGLIKTPPRQDSLPGPRVTQWGELA
jgi:hypothetical protein